MSGYKILSTGLEEGPDISIAMLTYNHGKYINQAIESVLMQKTTYSYEIVVVEDYSTDNTREILLRYKEQYPQKIKLILQDKNVGAASNGLVMLSNLAGRYVAMLEGDDYWTDPYKLQKQIDFLEKNKDFSSSFHSVNLIQEGKLVEDDIIKPNEISTIYDLARGNYIRTCSYVFRNNLIQELPDNFKDVHGSDYFYFMLIAKYGKIKKFPEVMAVYRKHEGGIWSTKDSIIRYKTMIGNLELLFPHFNDDVVRILKERHADMFLQFATYLVSNESLPKATDYLYKSMGTNAEIILDKIVRIIYSNITIKGEQKSLKSTLRNILNITKERLIR